MSSAAAMRKASVLCVVTTLLASGLAAEESSVVTLDASSFAAFVEKTPLVLVEFYAPWCGHCKQLAPEYAVAAEILKAENVVLAKVDAADEKNLKLAEQYDVQGFPTLKLFKNQKTSDYLGERTSTAIVAFMRKKADKATKDLENDHSANEFKDGSEVAVIGFFVNKDSEAFKAFDTVADEFDDIPFGVVHGNGIREKLRAEKDSIILYKKFDDKRVVYEGEMQPDPINKFVTNHSTPLLVPFTEKNAQKIFGGSVKAHLIIFVDSGKDTEVLEKLAGPAAKYKGQVLFITVSPSEEQITEYFGVTASDMPAVRLADLRDVAMKKYVYDQPAIDEPSLERFIDDFFKGRLKATLKTEEPPAEDESPVKVVVSKSFKSIVLDDEKDVLIEFYAPWCGHCKELAPRYEALATKLQHAEKLVIAKINAEANEVENVVVEGFPTLRLYPATKKNSPIEYTGERTSEDIEAWLAKEATHKWDTEPAAAEAEAEAEAGTKAHEGSEL